MGGNNEFDDISLTTCGWTQFKAWAPFRVRSRLVPTDVTNALRAQGWTVESPFQCSSTARRQPHQSLFVAYLPTPDLFPSSDSLGAVPAPASGCPNKTWHDVYVWALLHLDSSGE